MRDNCPEVKPMKNFNIFEILGPWFVVQYYSSAEIAFTYHCMKTEFGLSNGNMDMKMKLTYKYLIKKYKRIIQNVYYFYLKFYFLIILRYAADPNEEVCQKIYRNLCI
jgi:hypothetical protein